MISASPNATRSNLGPPPRRIQMRLASSVAPILIAALIACVERVTAPTPPGPSQRNVALADGSDADAGNARDPSNEYFSCRKAFFGKFFHGQEQELKPEDITSSADALQWCASRVEADRVPEC